MHAFPAAGNSGPDLAAARAFVRQVRSAYGARFRLDAVTENETMSDLPQDSLLREIDEDIRRERYAKLWKRYGGYVITALVLLLAGVAGYMIWQERTTTRLGQAGEQFTAAVALASKDQAAAQAKLSAIAGDGPSGYAMLAAFQQAALLTNGDGERRAARTIYQELQQSVSDPIYRDLAVLLEAMVVLQQDALPIDADAIRAKLRPLAVDGNPWRFSARELMSLLAWKSGQIAEAKDQLTALAADPQTPATIRDRAQQILAQIG